MLLPQTPINSNLTHHWFFVIRNKIKQSLSKYLPVNGTQNITNSRSAAARFIIRKFVVDLIVGLAVTTAKKTKQYYANDYDVYYITSHSIHVHVDYYTADWRACKVTQSIILSDRKTNVTNNVLYFICFIICAIWLNKRAQRLS